jgi:hypothetical protein
VPHADAFHLAGLRVATAAELNQPLSDGDLLFNWFD